MSKSTANPLITSVMLEKSSAMNGPADGDKRGPTLNFALPVLPWVTLSGPTLCCQEWRWEGQPREQGVASGIVRKLSDLIGQFVSS